MSERTERGWEVICNSCGAAVFMVGERGNVLAECFSRGWVRTPVNGDFCRDCLLNGRARLSSYSGTGLPTLEETRCKDQLALIGIEIGKREGEETVLGRVRCLIEAIKPFAEAIGSWDVSNAEIGKGDPVPGGEEVAGHGLGAHLTFAQWRHLASFVSKKTGKNDEVS